jgi:hypothetical protein
MSILLGVLGFLLTSSAAILAVIGLFVRQAVSTEKPFRRAIGLIAALTVILGNGWFIWVFFFFSKWHGGDFSVTFPAYQRLCSFGVRATLLTLPVAFFGIGVRRVFAVLGSIVLLVLWVSIGVY